jgi:3-hydroxyacyl-CoA dehydrogenase
LSPFKNEGLRNANDCHQSGNRSSKDGEIAVITLNCRRERPLRQRDGLYAFNAAIADNSVKGIVLICDGRTFIAGADIPTAARKKGASLLTCRT